MNARFITVCLLKSRKALSTAYSLDQYTTTWVGSGTKVPYAALFVTRRATPPSSPAAAVVIRGRHAHIFIMLLREILWACRLDEDQQGQQHNLYPMTNHSRCLRCGVIGLIIPLMARCTSCVSASKGKRALTQHCRRLGVGSGLYGCLGP